MCPSVNSIFDDSQRSSEARFFVRFAHDTFVNISDKSDINTHFYSCQNTKEASMYHRCTSTLFGKSAAVDDALSMKTILQQSEVYVAHSFLLSSSTACLTLRCHLR